MTDAFPNGALAPVVGEIDRRKQVVPEGINRSFLDPRDSDELDLYEDKSVTLRTLVILVICAPFTRHFRRSHRAVR